MPTDQEVRDAWFADLETGKPAAVGATVGTLPHVLPGARIPPRYRKAMGFPHGGEAFLDTGLTLQYSPKAHILLDSNGKTVASIKGGELVGCSGTTKAALAKLLAKRRWDYPQESVKTYEEEVRDDAWDQLVAWNEA